MLTPEEQAGFVKSAERVRQAAESYLRTHSSQPSVVKFVANLHRGVTHFMQQAINKGLPIACQAGCNHCCCARVEAMPAEIFVIAEELARRPANELDHLVQRLKSHIAASRDAVTWNRQNECPFLANGLCSIYDVRPSACRKAHSLDTEKCEASAPEIPQDLGLAVAAEAMLRGTSDAYQELGLDVISYELGRAVLIALSDTSALSRWYDGHAVFMADPP
jgi:Fe-S-cluster containining protein